MTNTSKTGNGTADANILVRITENLGKLKRNETQMTPEDRIRYANSLKNLRNRIWTDAVALMQQFLFLGCRMPQDSDSDKDIFQKKVSEIMKSGGEDAIRDAAKTLFKTYDVNEFLKSLVPLNKRIFYTAYGDVWLRHCKADGGSYTNDIVDLEWNADYGLWIDKAKKSYGSFLPPTRELIAAAYPSEMDMAS